MVELARQAFNTNNFDLAVEIYERAIKENGPSPDLLLGLADSSARSGHFKKAFDAYSSAIRSGNIRPENLKHLVTALIEAVRQENTGNLAIMIKSCMFTCSSCRGLFNEPVTIPCGHTFCRKCLEKDITKICKNCGTAHYFVNLSSTKTNVLLTRLIEKWFPNEFKASRLKADGNLYFGRRDFEKAIELYSLALDLAPSDHLLLSNRSHAFASLDRFKEGLEDAERVIMLRPDWPKGYFRKGCSLYGLGQYEDTVVSFLQCLALDPSVVTAKSYLSKALHRILSTVPDDVKAATFSYRDKCQSVSETILENFSSSLLLPDVSMSTLIQLKGIINDTVENATSFTQGNVEIKPEFGQIETLPDTEYHSEVLYQRSVEQIKMEARTKCHSAPNSRPESPVAAQSSEKPRSLSIPNLEEGCRKRARQVSSECYPLSPTKESPQKFQRSDSKAPVAMDISEDVLNRDDFECSLCYRLMYDPVTTPCGHSFCRQCLDRCLDHASLCPLCKSSLVEYLAERRQAKTDCIEMIIKTYFPQEYEERKKLHEEEMTELAKMGIDSREIPIFVCALAYPGIPCPLHIFEPRYRLMVRQCMESGTRQFGMCICFSDDEDNFAEYGCMLEIREVQYFADGRSLVDCVGGRRFKVISKGKRDGYNVAKVEFLHDAPVTQDQASELLTLNERVYQESREWFEGLPDLQRENIVRHFGQFPALDSDFLGKPNGAAWSWWLLPVLPLDPRIQSTMLAMTSYRERLEGLRRVIDYVRRNRSRQ
ncbi:hypothetical protein FSP39_015593 [Pinctada imbricata]|uniref:LON peptidase N-terminal domain and RING finger protein 3 n=1 Tax=Pinctada imbricata TaxID=66713 RepID=A0AA88Y801_PINIB|nr:hypothetical protein FSP39_015593 [Pinctada imbricata]